MNAVVMAAGAWITFDGIVSIILYEKQSLTEQAIRGVRCVVGLGLIIGGFEFL